MSKVLISFVGTGALNKDASSERKYNTAKYHFDNGEEFDSSFVADALVHHYGIEKVILVGTVKSMWEEVYFTFCKNNGIAIDDDYAEELMMFCEKANAKSELVIPGKEKIEEALGPGSHIELIRYGLNKAEIEENESIILGIERHLGKGDELYVDITHSFRSLPLFLMNLLIYLKNVSNKHINISHISYGMLDVSRELGYAPVVELDGIMEINEWITGAYTFMHFGNGYQIARLVEKEHPSATKILNDFSDVMNLNHLDGVRVQARRLASIKNVSYSPIPSCIIPSTVNSFIEKFPADVRKSVFLLKTATWHYEHKNYSSSFISLLESILTHICDTLGLPSESATDMEVAKVILGKGSKIDGITSNDVNLLRKKISRIDALSESYRRINKIRNGLAHQATIEIIDEKTKQKKTINSDGMIKLLGEELKKVASIIH